MTFYWRFFTGLLIGLAGLSAAGCSRSPVTLGSEEHAQLLMQDREAALGAAAQEPAAGAEVAPQIIELSVEQAIARGYERNLDARVAAMEELSQQKNITIAKIRALPGVELSGGYVGRSNQGASSSESILTNQQSLEPSQSSEMDRRVAALTAEWDLLDAALALADAAKARDEAGVAHERHTKVIQNVERDIYAAYWRARVWQDNAKDAHDLLAEAQAQMGNVDQAAEARLVSHDQAGRQASTLAERERTLREMIERARLAEIELKGLLSLPMEASLLLTTAQRDVATDAAQLLAADTDKLEWDALSARPEMREEILKRNMSIRDTRREILQTFPGLNLLFSREYDSNKFLVDANWSDYSAKIVQSVTNFLTLPARHAAARVREDVGDARRAALNAAIVAQVHMARVRLAGMDTANTQGLMARRAAARRSHAETGKKMQGFASGQDELLARMDLRIESIRSGMIYADYQDAYAAMRNTLGQPVIGQQAVETQTLAMGVTP